MKPDDIPGLLHDLVTSQGWDLLKCALSRELETYQGIRDNHRPSTDAMKYAFKMEYELGMIDALKQVIDYPDVLLGHAQNPDYAESLYAIWKGSQESVPDRNGRMQEEGSQELQEGIVRRQV